MGVKIQITGEKNDTDEYYAALKLKEKFSSYFRDDEYGKIIIYNNATLFGQEVKDVDLVVLGELDNYSIQLPMHDNSNNIVNERVVIKNFYCTVEVKSHSFDGVSRTGTDFYVNYGANKHSVTSQSNNQKYALKNFFESTIHYSPYITNQIWFIELSKYEIEELLRVGDETVKSNVLSSEFDVELFFENIMYQKKPQLYHGNYVIDCGLNVPDVSYLKKALDLFSEIKTTSGSLTREKIEQITHNEFKLKLLSDDGKLMIYRGKAGCGKTTGLIAHAIELLKKDKRVLFLTYNNSLAADIRRLLSFVDLPDLYEENCISVLTIDRYLYILANAIFYSGNMSSEFYITHRNLILTELYKKIHEDNFFDKYFEIMQNQCELRWDYVLIDEAQDVVEIEKNIITSLYDYNHLLVADGGNQFVRKKDTFDWLSLKNKDVYKLKKCLRQKNNLIKFQNAYISSLSIRNISIVGIDNMIGGKVVICTNKEKIFQLCYEEKQKIIDSGNIAYDMMILTTTKNVIKENGEKRFSLFEKFKDNKVELWDGTNDRLRQKFAIYPEQSRVYQYDSCRGLEAWSVVCLDFDSYLENKLATFDPSSSLNELILESITSKKNKHLCNWAILPLSRSIDTLIITLSDSKSEISRTILNIAKEHPDFITLVE